MVLALSTGPIDVLNIRLNCRGSVHSPVRPHEGHCTAAMSAVPACSCSVSSRKRRWQLRHSTSGSVKFSTCPEASHTRGCIRMAASSPSMSSRS